MKTVYLAGPYSGMEEKSFRCLTYLAGRLMNAGYVVFSPVTHCHPIAQSVREMPKEHEFWMRQDLPFLAWADELWVLTLPGWEESRGVQQEIRTAQSYGMTIRYPKPLPWMEEIQ